MSKNLTLNSALNVPKLSCRLLFVSKLTKYMNDIANFFHSQCEVQNQYSGRTISNAREVDGLYYFEGDAIESGQAQVGSSSDISLFGGDQIMLWLFRLGHPSFSYLKQLFPSLFKNKNPLMLQCEICQLTKHHIVYFPFHPYKESKPFSLMHSDIWRPLRVTNVIGLLGLLFKRKIIGRESF